MGGSGALQSHSAKHSRYWILSLLVAVLLLAILRQESEYLHWAHLDKHLNKQQLDNAQVSLDGQAQASRYAALSGEGIDPNPYCLPALSAPKTFATYGSLALKSSRLYEGTGRAVQKALLRAQRGGPFRIGIIGGSITRGHGCPDPTFESLWHSQLLKWAEERFPQSKVEKYQASRPGLGSEFFAYCHGSVLPPDLDVVVIETAVNDWEWSIQAHTDFEYLVRGLLDRPSPPAIISLHSFTLYKTLLGGDTQLVLASYYDYPVIGSRPALLPEMQVNSSLRSDYFGVVKYGDHIDGAHPNCRGHIFLADLLTSYLEEQLCLATHPELVIPPQTASDWHFAKTNIEPAPIPRIPMHLPFSVDHVEPKTEPTCVSLEYAYSPKVEPKEMKGFDVWAMNPEKVFYRGQKPGDSITFEVDLRRGDKSKLFLYRFASKKYDLGDAECWIDDFRANATLVHGYWKEQYSVGRTERLPIPKHLKPGSHLVHCEIVDSSNSPTAPEGRNFLIIGVFAG